MEKNIIDWIKKPTKDNIMMEELFKIQKKELNNKNFYNKMKFGTAGIRGLMGAGFSKINSHTISAAAESFGLYLKKKYKNKKNKFIIIANDNRSNGNHYKEITYQIMKKHGIQSFILPKQELMATPLLSFCIRELGAIGGVNITASHNPKEYNGFKVYNNLGAQLLPKETEKITKIMNDLNFLEIEKEENYKPKIIKKETIEKYINKVSKIFNFKKEENKLKVIYSPMHGAGNIIGPKILNKINVKYKIVEKQSIVDENFSNCISPNPEEPKSYKESLSLAKKTKSDIVVITDPDADRVGVVAKHKKRWKYITGNQIASAYLNYFLSKLKREKKLPKDGYIVKSNVSTSLANKIAKKYSIQVIETQVGFKNIANVIQETKGTFLFGFEESYGFLINPNISRDKDAFQGIVAIIDLASYLKEKNDNIYSYIKKLNKKFGIIRNKQFSFKINDKQFNHLIKTIKKIKEINCLKVKKFINYNIGNHNIGNSNMYKIIFKDNSTAIIRPSGTEPKIKLYIEIIGGKKEELIDITYKEKIIYNFFIDETENLKRKKISFKIFFKYFSFFVILISILGFIFGYVYPKGMPNSEVWNNSFNFFKINKYKFLIGIFAWFFMTTISSWMRKRLITFQGEKVSWKHLLISGYMGGIISYITPMTIGGDAIGYWYLRKKGFNRSTLLSSFIVSTIMYQISTIMQSALFLPIGLPIYKMIYNFSDPQSKAAFIMFVTNVSWDIFATIMIISLTLSKTFQEKIVKSSIHFLEWLPFKELSDPGYISSRYQYEFREMRIGIKRLWKNKLILLEVFIYEMFPKIFSTTAILYIWLGVVKSDLPLGSYWSQVIAFDIVSTSNSTSITPGGSGTQEWLNMVVNKELFNPIAKNGSGKETAVCLDTIKKIIFDWPMLLFSFLLIPTILVGEKRKKNYIIKNKINEKIKKTKSNFYKIITLPWVMLLSSWILIILFI